MKVFSTEKLTEMAVEHEKTIKDQKDILSGLSGSVRQLENKYMTVSQSCQNLAQKQDEFNKWKNDVENGIRELKKELDQKGDVSKSDLSELSKKVKSIDNISENQTFIKRCSFIGIAIGVVALILGFIGCLI